jgi:hypothetical protein
VAPSFRTVIALSIPILPPKATRKHDRTVVTGKCKAASQGQGKGKLTVLDEDGNEVELDATCIRDGATGRRRRHSAEAQQGQGR